jgi:hypothetical protein
MLLAVNLDPIMAAVAHGLAGGFGAILVVGCAVVFGSGSLVSEKRRLPNDSDARSMNMLGAAGAAIGIGLSFAYGAEALSVGFFIATLGVTGFFGLLAPLPLVSRLNNEYMQRAILCYEFGDYHGAYEDASEVARSCERHREQAQEIADAANQAQRDTRFGGASGGAAPTAQRYAV